MFIAKLKEYATHTDVAELNTTIYAALDDPTLPLNATDHALLRLLGGHSCRVPGVSWLRVDTMARLLEKSERTVRRSLKRLEDLAIIERFKVGRLAVVRILSAKMSTTENAETSDTTGDSSVISRKEAHLSSEAQNTELSNNVAAKDLPADYAPDYVPGSVIKTLAPFFGAEQVAEIYNRVRLAYDRALLALPLEAYDTLICRTLKTVVYSLKRGRIKGGLYAYVYGAFCNVLTAEKRREVRGRQPFAAWIS